MISMSRKRAGAHAKWLRLRSKPATTGFSIKLAYWNCNGISSLCKQQEIVEALNSKELDLRKVLMWTYQCLHLGHQFS